MGPIKVKHQIPQNLQSCHTTLIGGYVVEGHVPASDVARLLKEKPKGILGLTIPGMPQECAWDGLDAVRALHRADLRREGPDGRVGEAHQTRLILTRGMKDVLHASCETLGVDLSGTRN